MESNLDQTIINQSSEFDADEAALEEANYWFTINEFVELMLRYGPDQVVPDFEKQMQKAKEAIFGKAKEIIVEA